MTLGHKGWAFSPCPLRPGLGLRSQPSIFAEWMSETTNHQVSGQHYRIQSVGNFLKMCQKYRKMSEPLVILEKFLSVWPHNTVSTQHTQASTYTTNQMMDDGSYTSSCFRWMPKGHRDSVVGCFIGFLLSHGLYMIILLTHLFERKFRTLRLIAILDWVVDLDANIAVIGLSTLSSLILGGRREDLVGHYEK